MRKLRSLHTQLCGLGEMRSSMQDAPGRQTFLNSERCRFSYAKKDPGPIAPTTSGYRPMLEFYLGLVRAGGVIFVILAGRDWHRRPLYS